jgi:hypothetical protein
LKPHIQKITAAYVFVDHKKTVAVEFERSELKDMIASFTKALKTVNTDDLFEPQVNKYCKFCPATQEQCEYASKKGF